MTVPPSSLFYYPDYSYLYLINPQHTFVMAKIYVASSWRNQHYPEVVECLRAAGHEVYDFRNPPDGGNGFRWTDIDENASNWTFEQYAEGLHHPKAEKQFIGDLEALEWADTCVLVLPCGRSAHTEAGWMAGAGKRVIVYIPEMQEPELMYKLFDKVVGSLDDLVNCFNSDGNNPSEIGPEAPFKQGLQPWVGDNPKVLILGTMAGDKSIKAQAYYDSPTNPFWKLMADIFQPSKEELARGRKAFITGHGIALWDCIASGVRIGSSDSGFSERTLRGNDIQGFLEKHPTIHTIILNGVSTTIKYFDRYCHIKAPVKIMAYPSTASMITYQKKLEAWSELKELVGR